MDPSSAKKARDRRIGPAGGSTELHRRLDLFGAATLADVELLALVLGGPASRVRAEGLLQARGNLAAVAAATPAELRHVEGVGFAGAAAIAGAVELSRRLARLELPWAEPLRRPDEVARFVRATLRHATQEHFLCLGLDARQRLRVIRTVAVGSLASVEVHPRELFRPMIREGMHACILVHNHPSGDPRPSAADVELTRRMVEVGRLVGIPVLDHVVVTDADSVSLASLGLVERT